jgi:predicted alpha/beta-fold hydrolase
MGLGAFLFLGFLLLLLVCIIVQLTRKNQIKVEANPVGAVAPILARMPSLNEPYRPTPWLLGGLWQTVYGMRRRKRSNLLGSEKRVLLPLFDGGEVAFDFFLPPTPDRDAPFVIILPTVGATTWEPCTNNFAEAVYRRGWPSAVLNGRGFAGIKFKTPRMGVAIDFEDVRDAVNYVHENYHPPHIFIVGFSMGSMQAISYASQDNPAVDGVAVVSHSYDCVGSSLVLEKGLARKYLTPAIMKSIWGRMDKNPFASEEEKAKCRSLRTLRQFDNAFTAPSRGIPTADEYYSRLKLETKIPQVKVPTLVLGADNDPFVKAEWMPVRAAKESENVALVHSKEGGHVSFLTGWDARKSLIDVIVPEWIQAVVANKASK